MNQNRIVAAERTGWRDESLSRRHRLYGWDCPCLDIDCLFLEYDHGKPIAIIEYKNERAAEVNLNHPSINAIRSLANASHIPALIVRYSTGFTWFTITEINKCSAITAPKDKISELDYVTFMYLLRGKKIPMGIEDKLISTIGVAIEEDYEIDFTGII